MLEKEIVRVKPIGKEAHRGELEDLFSYTTGYLARHAFSQPFFIGISGASASGKSTISRKLSEYLSPNYSVGVIDMDWYLDDKGKEKHTKRQDDWPPLFCGYDPAVFNLPVVANDLMRLKNNELVKIPQLDRTTHIKTGHIIMGGKNIYIVEGMRVLDEEISTLTDQSCLVEANFSTRLIRRILRNIIDFKRPDIDELITRYVSITEPGYQYYVDFLKRKSDFILNNEEGLIGVKLFIKNNILSIAKNGELLLNAPIAPETETILRTSRVDWSAYT